MNLQTYIDLLLASLAAFATDRDVSRDFKTLAQLDSEPGGNLANGRFTLVSDNLGETNNISGDAVRGGTWTIAVVGQIKLAENATGSQVEDAEFAMFNQLVNWLNSPIDDEINCLEIKRMTQSKQLETPYGWIAVTIEVTL